MKKFFKVVGYPQPRVFWIAREILSNFDFLRGGGGYLFDKNVFCGKFDETSLCTGPGLISALLEKLEPF